MLKEVRFRFRHDGCWLQETTERRPDIMLVCSSVYNAGSSVVMNVTVHARDEVADDLEERWGKDARIQTVRRLHDGPRGVRFHVTYNSPHSIFHHILEHTPVSIGTIRVAAGQEHYCITGEAAEIQGLLLVLQQKGELVVETIRDAGAPADESEQRPWASLTDKQLEALVLAHAGGYYHWPRDRSATALADELGLSSSAFLDHLRHAESKVIEEVLASLREAEPGRIEALLHPVRATGR